MLLLQANKLKRQDPSRNVFLEAEMWTEMGQAGQKANRERL